MKPEKIVMVTGIILLALVIPAGLSACADKVSTSAISTDSSPTATSLAETTVQLIPTSVSLTSSKNPCTHGDHVFFTATVSPGTGNGVPGGTVQFTVDGTNFGNALLLISGKAISNTVATSSLVENTITGNHTVKAFYSGDTNFAASFGGVLQTVNPLPTSTTTSQNSLTQGKNINGIWGNSTSNVFAVGREGLILHYDGSKWTTMSSGTNNHLADVWGSSPTDVFAVGYYGTILHFDGSKWSGMTSGISSSINSVWGSSSSDVFAVGIGASTESPISGFFSIPRSIILHYNGKNWNVLNTAPNSGLSDVWGISSDSVFAVGGGSSGISGGYNILQFDGEEWLPKESVKYSLRGIWGTSAENVFVVGSNSNPSAHGGIVLNFNGKTWSQVQITNSYLYDIWGSSASDIFVTGERGTILHYNGSTWEKMDSGTASALLAIWGSSASDVYAVGEHGTIIHYDGKTWNKVETDS